MSDVYEGVEKVKTTRDYRKNKPQNKPGKYGDTSERTTIDRAMTTGESVSLHNMMFAEGCGRKSAKTGLSSFFEMRDLDSGARNSAVRPVALSLEDAIAMEEKYGARVPDHLILDR